MLHASGSRVGEEEEGRQEGCADGDEACRGGGWMPGGRTGRGCREVAPARRRPKSKGEKERKIGRHVGWLNKTDSGRRNLLDQQF